MTSGPTVGRFASDARHLLLALLAAHIVSVATTPSRTLVLVAVVLAAPDLSGRHDWRPVLWSLGLCVTLWASIGRSIDPTLSTRVTWDMLIVVVMFAAYRLALTDRRAVALIGGGYLVGCGLLLRELLAENTGAALSLNASASARYTIEGVNQNYIAFTMSGGIAVAILLVQVLGRRWLPALLLAGLMCWAGILLNDTRAAMLAGIAATVWWLAIPGRFRRVALRVLVVGVMAVAVGIFTGAADDRLRALFTASSERDVGGLNGRLDFWPTARDLFFEHPWSGIGAGVVTRHLPHGVFAHDVFLDVGTSAGVVGIAVLLGALYAILFQSTRGLTDSRRHMLIGVAVCATAAPLLAGYWYQAAPFWLLLAMFSRVGVLEPRGDGDEADPAVAALARVEGVPRAAAAPTAGPVTAVPAGSGRRAR